MSEKSDNEVDTFLECPKNSKSWSTSRRALVVKFKSGQVCCGIKIKFVCLTLSQRLAEHHINTQQRLSLLENHETLGGGSGRVFVILTGDKQT